MAPPATLADQALLDQKEMMVSQGAQETLVMTDKRETEVTQVFLARMAHYHLHKISRGIKENREFQVSMDHQEQRVLLGSLETLVSLGKTEGQDNQDLQVPKGILVSQEFQGLLEAQDPRVAWGRWDYQDLLD